MTEQQTFELIISTESKVLTCNIADFEKQAEQFLSTLTQNFETDNDFAQAKEEVKLLKELEDKTRAAIKNAQQGDINKLIAQAEAIANKFRDERLSRDKLVKAKEAEFKQRVVDKAIKEIMDTRHNACGESSISLALEITHPKHEINQRVQWATKNKRTIDGLEKSVNAEKTLILAEISQEIARLQSRLKLIPISHNYLFNDTVKLIASTDDLEPIIQARIEAENQREAEIKAKAEQQAIEKAKQEAENAKIQTEAKAIAQEIEQSQSQTAVENSQNSVNNEPLENFVITIRLTQTSKTNAIEIARSLKARFGESVSLNKMR